MTGSLCWLLAMTSAGLPSQNHLHKTCACELGVLITCSLMAQLWFQELSVPRTRARRKLPLLLWPSLENHIASHLHQMRTGTEIHPASRGRDTDTTSQWGVTRSYRSKSIRVGRYFHGHHRKIYYGQRIPKRCRKKKNNNLKRQTFLNRLNNKGHIFLTQIHITFSFFLNELFDVGLLIDFHLRNVVLRKGVLHHTSSNCYPKTMGLVSSDTQCPWLNSCHCPLTCNPHFRLPSL